MLHIQQSKILLYIAPVLLALFFAGSILFLNTTYFIALMGIIVVLPILIMYPEVGLIFYATSFDYFSYIGDILHIPLGMRSFFLGGVLLAVLIPFALYKQKSLVFFRNPVFLTALFFGIVMLVGYVFLTPSSDYGIWKLESYLLFNLLSMIGIILFSGEILAQRRMVYTLSFIGIISCITSFYTIRSEGSIIHGRFSGFSNPIWFSRSLGTYIFAMILVIFTIRQKLLRILLCFSIVVLFYFMLVSGSKGPMISFILTLTIFFTLLTPNISLKKKIAVLCFLGGIIFLFFPHLDEATQVRFDISDDSYGSISSRKDLMSDAFYMFLDNPVFGKGPGAFGGHSGERLYPHNILLEIAAELGVAGLVVFIIFLFLNYGLIKKLFHPNMGRLARDNMFIRWSAMTFIFSFINALFSGDTATNSLLWFSSGALIAANNTHTKEKIKNEDTLLRR